MAQVYKSIELVGVSKQSFDEAVRVAVRRAGESMRGLQWLELMEQRAYISGADVQEFQVKVRIWFELEGEADG
jgi:flavin-binding protein dodecin